MVNEIETNEPAFPRDHNSDGHNGISVHDYFAAKAMQAVITAVGSWGPCSFRDFDVDAVTEFANRQADSMVSARSKK